MLELVEHYLARPDLRKDIRINAQKLAHEKHTYEHRIGNIIALLDGNASEFDGFIQAGPQ